MGGGCEAVYQHSLTRGMFPWTDAGAVVPDEVLFSVLIRAYGAAPQPPWGDISALLGRMKHTWGISPSTVTYAALLEICAATNDYERGCQVRAWMFVVGMHAVD